MGWCYEGHEGKVVPADLWSHLLSEHSLHSGVPEVRPNCLQGEVGSSEEVSVEQTHSPTGLSPILHRMAGW